jgi:hypothetical protein
MVPKHFVQSRAASMTLSQSCAIYFVLPTDTDAISSRVSGARRFMMAGICSGGLAAHKPPTIYRLGQSANPA